MGSIIWLAIAMVAIEGAYANTTRHWTDDFYASTILEHLDPPFKTEKCSDALERERYVEILKSECGAPKPVLVKLLPPVYLEVYPLEVWLKRCVGYCSSDVFCKATKEKTIKIPVRVYNAKTGKESCGAYPVVEHETCGCRYEDSSYLDDLPQNK